MTSVLHLFHGNVDHEEATKYDNVPLIVYVDGILHPLQLIVTHFCFIGKRAGLVFHDKLFWMYFKSPDPFEEQLIFLSYDGSMCRRHHRLSDAEKRAHPSGFVITAYEDEHFLHELLSEDTSTLSPYTVEFGNKTFHFGTKWSAEDFENRMDHKLYPYDGQPLLYQFAKETESDIVSDNETNDKKKLTNMDIFKVDGFVHVYARQRITLSAFFNHAFHLYSVNRWDVLKNEDDLVIKVSSKEWRWKDSRYIVFGNVNLPTALKFISECAYRIKKALNKP